MRRLLFYTIIVSSVVCFLLIVSYFLIPTSFVARLASQQLSKLTSYSISIGKINYSVTKFYEISLDDVVISDVKQEITNIPKLIIGLDKDNVWQLNHFNYITIINGVINGTNEIKHHISTNSLNLIDTNVNFSINNEKDNFSFQQVNGSIKPFAVSNQEKYQFELTSQQVLFNQTPIKSVLIQGFYEDNVIHITNLGGNINDGFFVSKLKILPDNSLDIDQLNINNFHLQLTNENNIDDQLTTFLSKFTIRQFYMFNSSIQLPSVSIENGNIEATNISYDKQWHLGESSLVFNAEKLVWNNEVFSSVLLQLNSQNDIYTIEKAIASWSRGNFNFSGIWQDNQLKLDQITLSNVYYQLPEKLEHLILPDIFKQVIVHKLIVLPSILIRAYPDYPFTLVNFQISGSDLTIVQDNKLGLYSGKLFFNAERGSINSIDIKYPDLAVNFDSKGHTLLSFSTFISSGGMVESTATMNPSQTEFLSLKFTAYNVTSSLLNEWKLANQLPEAVNYTVDLHGRVAPFSLFGTFSTDGNDYVIIPEH